MKDGRFVRQANRFTDRIGTDEFPAEAGRYRLYASLACPWAHRALIVRGLLGLEDTIGVTIVDPIRDERGWRFTLSPDDRDPSTRCSPPSTGSRTGWRAMTTWSATG
jgi:putative glutathione S-transferase